MHPAETPVKEPEQVEVEVEQEAHGAGLDVKKALKLSEAMNAYHPHIGRFGFRLRGMHKSLRTRAFFPKIGETNGQKIAQFPDREYVIMEDGSWQRV